MPEKLRGEKCRLGFDVAVDRSIRFKETQSILFGVKISNFLNALLSG